MTLGTVEPYRFDKLVDNILAVLPAGTEVTWQTGSPSRTDLPVAAVNQVRPGSSTGWRSRRTSSSHARVGSLLWLLDLGVAPLIVPRRRGRGEHIDDHQQQVAGKLARAGFVQVRQAGDITSQDLTVTTCGPGRFGSR